MDKDNKHLEIVLSLKGDPEMLCDKETLDNHYNGNWEDFIESMVEEQGKFEFIDWFEIKSVVKTFLVRKEKETDYE